MRSPIHLPTSQLRPPGWLADFQTFIARGNVIDLAVGIIIGAAFTTIVNSLVKDLLTPLIGLLVGGIDFSDLFVTLKGAREPTLEAARQAGAVTLNFGLFLNALIQFLIVSFAIFWLVRLISKLHHTEAATAAPTASEQLLAEIRDLLAAERGASAMLPARDALPPP